MPKASRSVPKRARHRKWLKRAKGYRGRRSKVFKLAKEAVLKAGQYAYRDRRKKKSTIRQRWQVHINAAARRHGTTYARLVHGLRLHNIALDRKILAQLAQEEPDIFREVIETATQTPPASKHS